MKYINTFEKWTLPFFNKHKPKVGDYVICKVSFRAEDLRKFIDNNIGIITKKRKPNLKWGEAEFTTYYSVKYDNIPEEFKRFFKSDDGSYHISNDEETFSGTNEVEENEIIHFSKNKEDLELILDTNKYNL